MERALTNQSSEFCTNRKANLPLPRDADRDAEDRKAAEEHRAKVIEEQRRAAREQERAEEKEMRCLQAAQRAAAPVPSIAPKASPS